MAKTKKTTKHEISQEDLDNNPGLENEVSVGDEVELPAVEEGVVVEFRGGTRAFSKEIHGKDYKSIAKEFATTNNGTIL